MIEASKIKSREELKEVDFKRLSLFIYDNYGINLYPAKRMLLQSRLLKRLTALGFDSYTEYCDYVLNPETDPSELQEMLECITTNKTEFFRENRAFDFIQQSVLPEFANGPRNGYQFRSWSAGASTGKEAYTLAMVLSDFASNQKDFRFEILASDISMEVLKLAQTAIYPMEDVQEIPIHYRKKYLLKSKARDNKRIRIVPALRERVKFFWLNLLSDDYNLKDNFDLILCRNTMIYFDRSTQKRIVDKFLQLIHTGGYLVLGQSESLINLSVKMKQVAPSIYKKI